MTPVQQTISGVAEKATVGGSVGSVVGWAASSDFGMWAGIVIGLAGLIVNWYFKRKADRRQQEAHEVFLAKLQQPNPRLSEPPEESGE